MHKPALATILLLAWTVQADATVMVPIEAAMQDLSGRAGLSGAYYNPAPGSTGFDVADTLAAMTAGTVAGTFQATSLDYNGSDTSAITDFLGVDGASYQGRTPAANDLSDAILGLSGFLKVASAGTYTFGVNHDDSAQITIGGQTILSAGCCGTDTVDVAFGTGGYYAINIIYSNTFFGDGAGAAGFTLTENGTVLTSASLVSNVPEPCSLALLGAALAGTIFVRRRTPAMA